MIAFKKMEPSRQRTIGSAMADRFFDPTYRPTIEEQDRRKVRAFQNIQRRLDSLIAYEMGHEHGRLDVLDRLDTVGVMPQYGDEIVVLYKTIEKWQGKAVADAVKRASTKTYTGRFKSFTSWLLYHTNIATYASATLDDDGRAQIIVDKFFVYEMLPDFVRSIRRKTRMKKRKTKPARVAQKTQDLIPVFIDELLQQRPFGPEIVDFVFKAMKAPVNFDILDSQLKMNRFPQIALILKNARHLENTGLEKKEAAIKAWQGTFRSSPQQDS